MGRRKTALRDLYHFMIRVDHNPPNIVGAKPCLLYRVLKRGETTPYLQGWRKCSDIAKLVGELQEQCARLSMTGKEFKNSFDGVPNNL